MLNLSIQQAVQNHWRLALMGTASVMLSACVGGGDKSSSSEAQSSSVAQESSSSVVEQSSSIESSSSVIASSSSVVVVPSSSSVTSSSSVESSSESSSSEASSAPSVPSLLSSPGTFDSGFEAFQVNSAQGTSAQGTAQFSIAGLAGANPWDIQMWHAVDVTDKQQYTICYDAKASTSRDIEVNIDNGDPSYASVLGAPINGSVVQAIGTSFNTYSHTFLASETKAAARLTFNLAQANGDVELDNIGVYEGAACGTGGSGSSQGNGSSEGSSSSSAPVVTVPWTIEKIGCNDPDDYTGRAAVLFNGSGNFNGNFFNKTFTSGEYANLSRAGSSPEYTLGQSGIDDASCSGRKVHEGTWLKKLRDTDSQHSNGFSTTSLSGTFADIDSVVLELRVNSDLTDMPTQDELHMLYDGTIGAAGVDKLDSGKVAFAITLGSPDADSPNVRGEAYVEIDQDMYADQWIRISIPKDAFYYWTGANWQKTPASQAQIDSTSLNLLHMNPETKGDSANPADHGVVVRNIYGYSAWEQLVDKPEEDFKEMNISIRTFEIRFDPTDGNVSSSSAPASSSSAPASSSSAPMSSSSAASSESGVSEQEREARVAAGKELFDNGSVGCGGCHGAAGVGGPFGSIVVGAANNVCTSCDSSYENLVESLANGIPNTLMPACKPEGNCAEQLADYIWADLNGQELPVVDGGQSSSSGTSSSAPATGSLEEYFAANECGVEYTAMGNGGWASCYRLEGGLAGCKKDMTSAAPTILEWNDGQQIDNVMQVTGDQSDKAIVITDDGAAYSGVIGTGFDRSSPIVASGAITATGGYQASTACIITKNGSKRDLVCASDNWGRPALPADFDVMQVSASYPYTCALNRNGEVWCWGASAPAFMSSIMGSTPSKVPFEEPMRAISASQNTLCGLQADGGVACYFSRYTGPYLPIGSPGFDELVVTPENFQPTASMVHAAYKMGVIVDQDGTASYYDVDGNSGIDLGVFDIVGAAGKRNISSNGDAAGVLLMESSGQVHAISKGAVVQVAGPAAENPVCNF